MAGQTVPRHTTVAFVEFLNDIVTSQPELARFIETPRTSMVALYFAKGSGRTWNFTTFGLAPFPPSWCHGVYIE